MVLKLVILKAGDISENFCLKLKLKTFIITGKKIRE